METFWSLVLLWIIGGWLVWMVTPMPKSDLLVVAKSLACGPIIWLAMRVSIRPRRR